MTQSYLLIDMFSNNYTGIYVLQRDKNMILGSEIWFTLSFHMWKKWYKKKKKLLDRIGSLSIIHHKFYWKLCLTYFGYILNLIFGITSES